MKKVLLFSILLVLGLVGSQFIPGMLGEAADEYATAIRLLTYMGLAFIMIHVGYEFDIDKKNLKPYGKDYLIAFTAATFPWIFVALYMVFVLLPQTHWGSWAVWKETLLASRFAAPTSAGVLFSMLAAAGLSATWMFKKARILAIFDDLDTVLLMIPLKMAMVGLAWQLGSIVLVMAGLLAIAWVFMHKVRMPVTWPWVLTYSAVIVAVIEVIYRGSKVIDPTVPIHLEPLLPAFVLGCIMAYPPGCNPHADDHRVGHQEGPEQESEQRASTIVAGVFMVLVGLCMPMVLGEVGKTPAASDPVVAAALADAGAEAQKAVGSALTSATPAMSWGQITLHVLVITVISNIGKMFPMLCYRKETSFRQRLAVGIGLWPRGEVGAGVLVVSLGYGIGGPVVVIAMLSLALNLMLTGVFIAIISRIIRDDPEVVALRAQGRMG